MLNADSDNAGNKRLNEACLSVEAASERGSTEESS